MAVNRFPSAFNYFSDDQVDIFSLFEKEAGFYKLRKNATFVQHFNLTGEEVAHNGYYTTGYNFSYLYTFGFEENFEPRSTVELMIEYYWIANYFIAGYVMAIFGIQHFMKDRQPYVLRGCLFFWNLFLAIFSTWGALRAIPEMIHLLANYGFNFTVCFSGKPFLDNRVGGFWNWMFTLSKVPELGDTIFIVLRKQPLIFLHWYHHVTVLLFSWYSYPDYIATARWFICMNYLVHSVMYTYYALKAVRVRVPRWIAMGITTAQLAQMVMGTAVNIWAYQIKQAGNECHVSYENINLSLLMYTSYFVLFARFFRRAYIRHPKPETKEIKNGDATAVAFDFEKRKGTKHD